MPILSTVLCRIGISSSYNSHFSLQKVDLSVVRGRGLSEVHQQFSDYASQIVRVRDGSPVVELGENK